MLEDLFEQVGVCACVCVCVCVYVCLCAVFIRRVLRFVYQIVKTLILKSVLLELHYTHTHAYLINYKNST